MEELVIRDGRCLNREDGDFEAKSARRGIPQSMWESYSAFANTSGGTIVLGLDESEDGTGFLLSGVKNASGIRDDLWSTLNNPEKISVNILTDRDLEVIEIGGVELIVLHVPMADRTMRPVFVGNVNSGTYQRNGSGDYHCNAEDIAAIRVYEGSIIHTFEDVFYEVPTGAPQDVFGGTTDMFLVNGGKIHTISNSVSNTGRFGAPKSGDYHLSPWRVYCYWNYPLLFDEISSSFCSADPWDNKLLPLQDAGPDGSRDLPPVNNMDADLLFMGPTTDDCAYALLKKKQESN